MLVLSKCKQQMLGMIYLIPNSSSIFISSLDNKETTILYFVNTDKVFRTLRDILLEKKKKIVFVLVCPKE